MHTIQLRTLAYYLPVAILATALDQASKWWAVGALGRGRTMILWEDRLFFHLATNTGAAFSMFSDFPTALTILACLVAVVVLVWLARTPLRDWRTALALGLILGGAAGNLVDRFRLGKVIDFIQFIIPVIDHPWPTFNVADSAICVGMALLILATFFPHKVPETAPGGKAQAVAAGGAARKSAPEAPAGE